MDANSHARFAHGLLEKSSLPFLTRRLRRRLERTATAHATVAVALMLCEQSVCGHGVLQTHDDQRPDSTCRP